jgi:alkaline phosphatase D
MGLIATSRRLILLIIVTMTLLVSSLAVYGKSQGTWTTISDWGAQPDQRWLGSGFWGQRLQDWSIKGGALASTPSAGAPRWRAVHILSHELRAETKPFGLRVCVESEPGAGPNQVGFLLGAGAGRLDYRAAVLVFGMPGEGGGILAMADLAGKSPKPKFYDNTVESLQPKVISASDDPPGSTGVGTGSYQLEVAGQPQADGSYRLVMSVFDVNGEHLLARTVLADVSPDLLLGGVALVSDSKVGSTVTHRFSDLQVIAGRLVATPEHRFGPIANVLYTVSNQELKMSVQCMPLAGDGESNPQVRLLRRKAGSDDPWKPAGKPQPVLSPDYLALIRVPDWDDAVQWEVRAELQEVTGQVSVFDAIVRKNPVDKPVMSIAAMNCFGMMSRSLYMSPQVPKGYRVVGRWTPASVWHPYEKAIRAIQTQDVDVILFSGDQYYENKPTAPQNRRDAFEDALWRTLMFHLAVQPLTRQMPCLMQIDDHEYYHGNIWGDGGKLNTTRDENDGGYYGTTDFVNMVQRLFTAHMPDSPFPGPSTDGIYHYYTPLTWGGIGLFVLEDRKFKSPPAISGKVPDEDLSLLGEHQVAALEQWSRDWRGQTLKAVLSQTVYSNLHTFPDGSFDTEKDGNGWPKPARDRAVKIYRRIRAPIISGDQHLASFTIQGIEAPDQGVYQFAVPAIGNHFLRFLAPRQGEGGKNRPQGSPNYLGDFVDPHGNPVRVLAMANPATTEVLRTDPLPFRQRALIPLSRAYDGSERISEGDGYGVVYFDKPNHKITFNCFPHDYGSGSTEPYPGWPVTVALEDVDTRKAVSYLPPLRFPKGPLPVVEVINSDTNEIVSILRAPRQNYRPRVYSSQASYRVVIWRPEQGSKPVTLNLEADKDAEPIDVRFD